MNLALSHGAAFLLTEAEINPLNLVRQHLKASTPATYYPLKDGKQIIVTGSSELTMRANVKVTLPLGSRLPLLSGSTIIITEGVLEATLSRKANAAADPLTLLLRHCEGDWGEMPEDDKERNDKDVARGEGAMSEYKLPDGERIWVSTEWDRQTTTIFLPDEY